MPFFLDFAVSRLGFLITCRNCLVNVLTDVINLVVIFGSRFSRGSAPAAASAEMKKKIDARIRTMIENGVALKYRSLFVLIGDRGKDQVPSRLLAAPHANRWSICIIFSLRQL